VEVIETEVNLKEQLLQQQAGDGGAGGDEGGNDGGDDHPAPAEQLEPPPSDDEDGTQKVYIKMSPTKTISFCVNPTDTVYLLKSLIYAKENVPRRDQRLHFGETKDLEDAKALFEYEINDGDLLDLVVRGAGGAGKRGRAGDPPSKEMVLAELHGGLDLLLINASNETRTEVHRVDTAVRDWNFVDTISSANLLPMVEKVEAMARNITESKVSKLLAPYMTPLLTTLHARVLAMQKEIRALEQQCLISVVRLLPFEEDGYFDWQGFRVFLRARLSFRMGVESVVQP
jgi:hypothetical protein